METEAILQRARYPGDPPADWTVVPLNRPIVQQSAWLWAGAAAIGLGLAFALYLAIADIFQIFSLQTFVIVIFGFTGIGSAFISARKFRKLVDADNYLIVLTPDWFVEQQGRRIIAVPISEIANVTLRGVFGGDLSAAKADERDPSFGAIGTTQLFGGRQVQRTRRTPDSLAFIDQRTDKPVIVAEDNSFAELPVLEEILRQYLESVPRARTH